MRRLGEGIAPRGDVSGRIGREKKFCGLAKKTCFRKRICSNARVTSHSARLRACQQAVLELGFALFKDDDDGRAAVRRLGLVLDGRRYRVYASVREHQVREKMGLFVSAALRALFEFKAQDPEVCGELSDQLVLAHWKASREWR